MALVMFAGPARAGCVVLLHGLARTEASMMPIELALRRAGKEVVNLGYPSTEAPVEELLVRVDEAVARCPDGARVDFVTHSLGGILLRAWAEEPARAARIGRAVMLGPPNGGSELVDWLAGTTLFDWLNGPAGEQLGTSASALPARLGPLTFEAGVIAGRRSLNPVYSSVIPGRDDGKVSVDATRIAGMADHVVIGTTHTFMMANPLVVAQTLAFLEGGRFEPGMGYAEALARLAEPAGDGASVDP